eukprot:3926833-Alexandrium_andersonii.AAC.1
MVLKPERGGKLHIGDAGDLGLFESIFFRAVSPEPECLRCDMFFAAPAEEVSRAAVAWAARLNLGIPVGGPPPSCEELLLADGKHYRREAHMRVLLERAFHMSAAEIQNLPINAARSLVLKLCKRFNIRAVFDLEQNVGYGTAGGLHGMLPCLVSHFSMYSVQMQRCLLPSEACLAQAFPMFGISKFSIPWAPLFEAMSPAQQKDLIGNSMHLEVFGALFGFALAACSPVDASLGMLSGPERLIVDMPGPSNRLEDEDSEGEPAAKRPRI